MAPTDRGKEPRTPLEVRTMRGTRVRTGRARGQLGEWLSQAAYELARPDKVTRASG
jgi:hypothetical protein